jgi:phenylacetate-coenzyme A ligase PaaK-like adenylate-forming protein
MVLAESLSGERRNRCEKRENIKGEDFWCMTDILLAESTSTSRDQLETNQILQ